MSRFVNLELDGESEGQGQPSKPLVKDEAYYCGEARAALQNGEFESALRLYSKVLEFNPRNAAAWAGQVRMLTELGECREARLWADKALERFPHEPELLAAKAVALGRSGDLQGALAFSDAAIEEQGDTPVRLAGPRGRVAARERSRARIPVSIRRSCWRRGTGLSPGWRRGFAFTTGSLRWPSSSCSRPWSAMPAISCSGWSWGVARRPWAWWGPLATRSPRPGNSILDAMRPAWPWPASPASAWDLASAAGGAASCGHERSRPGPAPGRGH